MEEIIVTYHDYSDKTVNADIAKRSREGWHVKQFEYSAQTVGDRIRACVIILYERDYKE